MCAELLGGLGDFRSFSELRWSCGQPKTDKVNSPWRSLRDIELLVILPGNQIPRKELELLGSANSPDGGKRGVKEQGRPKSPIHSHTHIWNAPQQGGSQNHCWENKGEFGMTDISNNRKVGGEQ